MAPSQSIPAALMMCIRIRMPDKSYYNSLYHQGSLAVMGTGLWLSRGVETKWLC